MIKCPKVVVIQEKDLEKIQVYEATLKEGGFICLFISSEKEILSDEIVSLSPDIILLKFNKLDTTADKFLAIKRSLSRLRRSKLIIQVPKLSYSIEQYAKKNEISLLENESSTHSLLQLFKKLSLDVTLPTCMVTDEALSSEVSVDIKTISELDFTIDGPIKFFKNAKAIVNSKLMKSLNVGEDCFHTQEESTYKSENHYLTQFRLHGLSYDAYRNIKKYIGGHRGDHE